jgi:ATP-dependent protease Clp ATPase subunit
MWFRRFRCSFCRRDESQVARLVAGPHVYICDKCAYETIRIMEGAPPVDRAKRSPQSIRTRLFKGWRPSPTELRTAESL